MSKYRKQGSVFLRHRR